MIVRTVEQLADAVRDDIRLRPHFTLQFPEGAVVRHLWLACCELYGTARNLVIEKSDCRGAMIAIDGTRLVDCNLTGGEIIGIGCSMENCITDDLFGIPTTKERAREHTGVTNM